MIHEFHDIVDDKNLCDKAIDFFVNCNRNNFLTEHQNSKAKQYLHFALVTVV